MIIFLHFCLSGIESVFCSSQEHAHQLGQSRRKSSLVFFIEKRHFSLLQSYFIFKKISATLPPSCVTLQFYFKAQKLSHTGITLQLKHLSAVRSIVFSPPVILIYLDRMTGGRGRLVPFQKDAGTGMSTVYLCVFGIIGSAARTLLQTFTFSLVLFTSFPLSPLNSRNQVWWLILAKPKHFNISGKI